MFGPGGAARIALADWLVEEKLHGMYHPGKGPGPSSLEEETKQMWAQSQIVDVAPHRRNLPHQASLERIELPINTIPQTDHFQSQRMNVGSNGVNVGSNGCIVSLSQPLEPLSLFHQRTVFPAIVSGNAAQKDHGSAHSDRDCKR